MKRKEALALGDLLCLANEITRFRVRIVFPPFLRKMRWPSGRLTLFRQGFFFFACCDRGKPPEAPPPPSISSKQLMLRAPSFHKKMSLSFPTSRHNLIETMTWSDVILHNIDEFIARIHFPQSIDRFHCHATIKKINWKPSSGRSQENEMF